MSLYNLLFGKNKNSVIVLSLLGLKECDVERFRDCDMNKEGIHIYTRTGGGNRSGYPNKMLTNHKNYKYDEDDNFDCTYATYYFDYPEEIKEDCLLFLDINKNGIPSSIIKTVNKTLNRKETENDKWANTYDKHMNLYNQLRYNLEVYETNGHTIVPLSDESMEKLLKLSEENNINGNEGEFLPYSIKPYRLLIEKEVPKWTFESDNLCRIKISLGKDWIIDQEIWNRYKSKFSEKYPNAINAIKKYIDE
jgi:hypothetical protein